MNDIFDFIAVKKLQTELLFKILMAELSTFDEMYDNLYVSILPPIDDLYLIEFADFLPVTRYSDIHTERLIKPIARTFANVFYLYKNDQTKKSKYKKYNKGKMEEDHKTDKAFEKGLRFDLILEVEDIKSHVKKVWSCELTGSDPKPLTYQLVKDRKVLDEPQELDYTKFYGNE